MYPKVVVKLEELPRQIMEWEEKWNRMNEELEADENP